MNTEQILKSCETITLGTIGIDNLIKDADKLNNLEKENAKLKEKLNELLFIDSISDALDNLNLNTQLGRGLTDNIHKVNSHFTESYKKYKVEFVATESALGVEVKCILSKRK